MQKPIRRKERALSGEEAYALLEHAEYGFLATVDEDGEPYGIPISFVYDCGKEIYFHCAYEGQKIDNITRDGRVCFTVVGATEVISRQFTTKYQSVVVRGRAKMIEEQPKREALHLLCQKYCPADMDAVPAAIEKSFSRTCVIQLTIDSITGKAKR